MAGIRENKRNGKVVSYRFTACLDRDVNGNTITGIIPELFDIAAIDCYNYADNY